MARQILTRVAVIIKEVNRTSHKWSSHKISNFRVIQVVSRVIEVVVDGEVEAASVEVFLEVARTDSVGLLKHLTRDAKTLTAPSTTRLAPTGLATKITSSSNSRNSIRCNEATGNSSSWDSSRSSSSLDNSCSSSNSNRSSTQQML